MVMALLTTLALGAGESTYTNPLPVPVADPVVLRFDGIYYLYGTYGPNTHGGVAVYTSTDLVHWEHRGFALAPGPDTWSKTNFWGGEVVFHDGRFLMFYTTSPSPDPAAPLDMYLAAAASDSPLGPFTEVAAPLFQPPPGKQAIDQNLFIDDDGQGYLYFTFVEHGRNVVYGARLTEDLLSMAEEPVLCIAPEAPWESRPWEGHRVAEGAHMLKHGGVYYLFYCANHFLDPEYAIGYATSNGPLGPWERAPENPVLARTKHIAGPGNGAPVRSPDGKEWFLVYHVHENTSGVGVRQLALDRFRFEPSEEGPDRIVVTGPTHTPQPLPSGAED